MNYSKFSNRRNVNIPFAKVQNRVFTGLREAEIYCSEKGLNPDDCIEYGDSEELKIKIQEIARIQKAALYGVMDQLDSHVDTLRKDIDRCTLARKTCHPLEQGYWDKCITEAIAKHTEAHDSRKILCAAIEKLEALTGWKG